eukprot:Amastigsp_a174792_51.p2 type:complete len:124 gc:universal Amastigsp_a174792_51:309-680(+)
MLRVSQNSPIFAEGSARNPDAISGSMSPSNRPVALMTSTSLGRSLRTSGARQPTGELESRDPDGAVDGIVAGNKLMPVSIFVARCRYIATHARAIEGLVSSRSSLNLSEAKWRQTKPGNLQVC